MIDKTLMFVIFDEIIEEISNLEENLVITHTIN